MKRKYLLDTNAVADVIYDRRGVKLRMASAKKQGAKIGTCPPVLGELFFGAYRSDKPSLRIQEISHALNQFSIWAFGEAEAEEYGRLYAELTKIGRPMQVPDIQLAAVAIVLGNCTVVTSDSDLLAIPGLSVENWAA
ncbi:MAG: type II toxin-antitoxin system VapC family toxin [Fimbriiglobus sp.]